MTLIPLRLQTHTGIGELIISALKTAAERGKQVTVLVELKARFDEENNVQWAKILEEAGCHVIYGKTHLKTHSKIAMVVKQKNGRVHRYVHLGTGNYNDKTARFYTDMGIITTNEGIAEDATDFFNYLSGYSNQPDYHYLHVSPFAIRDNYIEDIEDEIQAHRANGNGHIIAKMNSLINLKRCYQKTIRSKPSWGKSRSDYPWYLLSGTGHSWRIRKYQCHFSCWPFLRT